MSLINAWRERRARLCLDDLRIESLRFRELLDNSRGLFDIFADGEEKSRGDYIIDMHYVTSLVDQTMESASRLVFDACVLASGAGDVLFPLLDEQKKTADAFHLAARDRKTWATVEESEGETPEPEYRLLNQVLGWFRRSPKESGGGRPMISLFQAGFDQVMAQSGFRDVPERFLRRLLLPSHEIGVVLREDPPGLAGQREVSLAELNCRPLGLMVEGTEVEEMQGGRGQKNKKWLAVVGEDYLSLRSGNGRTEDALRVEAMLSGDVDSDFVFMYAGCHHDVHNKLPTGLRIEETPRGRLGWTYDITEREVEETLIRAGRSIFE